jgi:hypothetical protein
MWFLFCFCLELMCSSLKTLDDVTPDFDNGIAYHPDSFTEVLDGANVEHLLHPVLHSDASSLPILPV